MRDCLSRIDRVFVFVCVSVLYSLHDMTEESVMLKPNVRPNCLKTNR
jgi:hypothetical protein